MRLNLGAGKDIKPGFINLDSRDIEGVVRCDVSDSEQMSRYQDASLILAHDILEHFPRAKAREVLKMWIDLLAPGGKICLRCPDIRHAAQVSLKYGARVTIREDEWFELLLYGGQDYPENQHLCGFTMATLSNLVQELGCKVVRRETTPAGNTEVDAVKP